MASEVIVTRSPIQTLESRVNSRLGSGSIRKSSGSVEGGDQAAGAAHLVVAQAGHHDLGQLLRTKISEIALQKHPQRLTEPDVGDEILNSLCMRSWVGQRLDQQLAQIEHLDPATAERLGETIVLLLRTVDPRQPVEEQGIVVARRQPPQLVARTVQQHRTQPANLGPDLGCRYRVCRHDGEITD